MHDIVLAFMPFGEVDPRNSASARWTDAAAALNTSVIFASGAVEAIGNPNCRYTLITHQTRPRTAIHDRVT